MRLYNAVVLMTYQALTHEKKFTPPSEYVEWKVHKICQGMFRGFDTDDYLDVLEASFSAYDHEDVESLCDEQTSYEEAARKCAYEAFAGDVCHWLLEDGHRRAIPEFWHYDSMLKKTVAWAEERADGGRTDKSPQEVLDEEIASMMQHKAPEKLRWLAKRTSAEVETAWLANTAADSELDRERAEMDALVDAVLADARDHLNA